MSEMSGGGEVGRLSKEQHSVDNAFHTDLQLNGRKIVVAIFRTEQNFIAVSNTTLLANINE